MAIEIKELIVRAIVDSQSENQEKQQVAPSNEENGEVLSYLESLMKNMQNKNER